MSLGSLNAYEEYPARWCWVPPSCRCYEEERSCSEESPQLSIFELELERREYERETQDMRPFFQKRMYWCFSLRRWQVLLLFFLIFGAFVGLLSASLYYSNEIIKRKKELNEINNQLRKKHDEIESAKARVQGAEEEAEEAEARARRAEKKVEEAEARARRAEKKVKQAEARARRAETRHKKVTKEFRVTKEELEHAKEKKLLVTRVAIYNTGVAHLQRKDLSSAKKYFKRLVDSELDDELNMFAEAQEMLKKIDRQENPPPPRSPPARNRSPDPSPFPSPQPSLKSVPLTPERDYGKPPEADLEGEFIVIDLSDDEYSS